MSTAVAGAPGGAPAAAPSGASAQGGTQANGAGGAPAGGAKAPGGEMPNKAGTNPGVQRRQPVVEHKGQPGAQAKPPAQAGEAPKGDPKAPADPNAQRPGESQADWWKRLNLKIGGAEETLEFDDPKDLVAYLQRSEAQKRALQKREVQIQARQKALELAAQDPIAAAKVLDPNFDPDAFALQRVQEMYELEQMDPKDRQIREYEQKLQRIEQERAEAERAQQEAAEKQAQEASRARWEKKIQEAIKESRGDEAPDPDYDVTVLLPAVAGVMYHARQLNPEGDPELELTPQEIAKEVRALHGKTFERQLTRANLDKVLPVASKQLAGLPDGVLLQKLGTPLVERIVKAHLEATRGGPAPAAPMPGDGERAIQSDDDRNEILGFRKGRAPPRL